MKIKYLIDTILSPQIKVLNFVDRYAGIVKTINIAVDNQTDKGQIKRYPVACDVQNGECVNTGLYNELVPDDSKNSVLYWELISPATNSGMTQTKDFYTKRFKGTARLVVWLNLAKLGVTECNGAINTLPILEKILTQKGKISGGIYDNCMLWIEPRAVVKQDIQTVFGGYDYPKLKNYYLYPFDFYAIDVNFTLDQCLAKGGTFEPTCAVDCVNEVPPTPPPSTSQVLWLKADAGINAGTPVDNDNVYIWSDQSGNSNDFEQLTATSQPIYNTNVIGCNPAVVFDYKAMNLQDTILLGTDYTIYFVAKPLATQTGTTDYKTIFMFSVSGYSVQTDGRIGFSYNNPNDPTPPATLRFLYDDRIARYNVNDYDTNAHYFTISNGDVDGTNKKQIYADGVQFQDLTAGINSGLGLLHFIGQWNNSVGQFNMFELIAYNVKHTDAERQTVELYLKTKYDL